MPAKILAMAGSLRKNSFNKKLIKIAAAAAQNAGADVTYIDLADYNVPIYHGDLEQQRGLPNDVESLQKMMLEHDGLLIASPEYNGSISGMFKNLIDWTSRPNGDLAACACYRGKISAIMSTSPGALGGVKNLIHLRTILSNIGCLVLPNQAGIPFAMKAFDETGKLVDEKLQSKIEGIGIDLYNTIYQVNN